MMTVVGFVMYGGMVLLPVMLQTLLGYPAVEAGIAMAPRGLGAFLMMPVVGVLTSHIDPRKLIAAGLVVGGVTLLWLGQLAKSCRSNDSARRRRPTATARPAPAHRSCRRRGGSRDARQLPASFMKAMPTLRCLRKGGTGGFPMFMVHRVLASRAWRPVTRVSARRADHRRNLGASRLVTRCEQEEL